MPTAAPRIGFVSLGCAKATVDSERILTQLRAEGYELVPDYDGADLVVVNTCGFITPAVDESLEAIGEALEENGRVIVTGCLGAREEVVREKHPSVLAVTGPHQLEPVMNAVHEALPRPHDPYLDVIPPGGLKLTPRHYAWLKISEGCNNRCTFCIIPSLRGDLVSRPISDVVKEAEALVSAGVRELLVVSQDTSAYGVDLRYREDVIEGRTVETRMLDLARELGQLGVWVRLHYVYPYPSVDHVVPLMAEGLVLPYLDIPFQHASPSVLKAMRRPAHVENTLRRIEAWRGVCPELALRSTFVVGFPGETEADFEELLAFLDEAQLDRVGAFAYSEVEGATANALPNPVSEAVKQERLERFMTRQAEISAAKLRERVGYEMSVLVDEVEEDRAVARSYADAPEIDGLVHVRGLSGVAPGDFVDVEIVGSDEHDLMAAPLL